MSGIDNELENDADLFEDGEAPVIEEVNEEILQPEDLFAEPGATTTTDVNPILEELLAAKGITDGKITIVGEDDKEEQVSFYDLPKEEQLEILKMEEAEPEPVEQVIEFAEGEQEFFEALRTEGITLDEYLTQYKEEAISEAGVAPEQSYDIDAYDNEELFLLDLKSKYDLTDDELTNELEKELKDPDLFTKKITKIREEYKELEDTYKQQEADDFAAKQDQEYGEFVEQMVDVAVNNSDFYGIELDDDEKNEVLSFILEKDEQGSSEFAKLMSEPDKLYEAAWFLRYGKEAFSALTNAYETEMKRLKEDKTPKKEKEKPNVVIKKDEQKPEDQYASIDDIF